MPRIHSKVGAPVTDEDFFDRQKEQGHLWEYLESGDVLLLAPRRVGKTSLMLRLAAAAPSHGFVGAYVTAEGVENELMFIERLTEALRRECQPARHAKRRTRPRLGKLLQRIRRVDAGPVGLELDGSASGTGTRWLEAGGGLTEALAQSGDRTLFLLDEVPVFVLKLLREDSTGERARDFLTWFRELRQGTQRSSNARWLLAGSIGLDTVASRLNLGSTLNDLFVSRLGPFDRPTAAELLRELGASYEFAIPSELEAEILDRIGWLIPFHVQLVFRELRTHCLDRGVTAGPEQLRAVFEDLLAPSKKAYFDTWRQRLREELGLPDAARAATLLEVAARDPRGVTPNILSGALAAEVTDATSRAETLRFLLDVLENDGYLVQKEGRFCFLSPLLREFWLRRQI